MYEVYGFPSGTKVGLEVPYFLKKETQKCKILVLHGFSCQYARVADEFYEPKEV